MHAITRLQQSTSQATVSHTTAPGDDDTGPKIKLTKDLSTTVQGSSKTTHTRFYFLLQIPFFARDRLG